jgi:hypothetical protein
MLTDEISIWLPLIFESHSHLHPELSLPLQIFRISYYKMIRELYPCSERWGNMMYDLDLAGKGEGDGKIRANLARNYNDLQLAPETMNDPQEGNMIKSSSGTSPNG